MPRVPWCVGNFMNGNELIGRSGRIEPGGNGAGDGRMSFSLRRVCEWGQGAWESRVLAPCPKGAAGSGCAALCRRPGISLIMWNALYTAEKVIIRWTLLTEACYFGVQFMGES